MRSTDNQISIVNATENDLPVIYKLFEDAILFLKEKKYTGWTSYDKTFIQKDIANKLLYKIVSGGAIICIFSVCYNDVLIWREMEKGDAIYLHRIVLNRKFAGQNSFKIILKWTRIHALQKGLSYIRMDTWADNQKIIDYYQSNGFSFLENYTTADTEDLPVQHRNLTVALLEYRIQ